MALTYFKHLRHLSFQQHLLQSPHTFHYHNDPSYGYPIFPECVARVPVSLWGSGGWGCVRSTLLNRSQPFVTVYGRAYGKFCRRGFWRFQTLRCFVSRGKRGTSWHSDVVESRFVWQAQYFCDVFARCVAVFAAGAALRTCPASFCVAGAALQTPHSTLYTSHSALYIPHFTLYTPHSTLYTLHFTPYTLHSKLDTLHSTLYTLHSTLYTPHFTPHFALHTLHSTLYTLHYILYTLHSTLHTLHLTNTLHRLHLTF